MRLSNTAFLLSTLLVVSVSGARKKSSVASPSVTPIVESDHVPAASSPMSSSSGMAQSRSSSISERGSSAGYSQPIYSTPFDPSIIAEPSIPEASYYDPVAQAPVHHHQAGGYPLPSSSVAPHSRHAAGAAAGGAGAGSYAAASSATQYAAAPYQQGYGYGGYGYDYPAGPGRYLAQGSHQDAYVAKRAHGYGGGYGWHPDLEVQTLFFIGIPLIIIPLLFLWPYFLYSLHYRGGHGGGYGGVGGGGAGGYGGGYYRSASGAAPDIVKTPEKELQEKTDELTKKVVPKLSKKSDSSSSSKKSSKSS